MTEPQPDEVVHQAFFGWSHDAGKLALLSHSFPHQQDAARWLRRLEAHLRLQPVPGTELPSDALSYFEYNDGSVAVLRRVSAGYGPGRNNSHALIGSAAVLGMPVALGLGNWSGWQSSYRPGRMEPIHPSYFRTVEEDAKRLRRLAEGRERELGLVLTRLLDDPRAPLSIIGCANEDRLAMVWGLREAADEYLMRQLGWHRPWSFSTYEDRHDVNIEGLPGIVFLPARPEGAGVVHRTVVDFDRDPPPSPNTALAGELVARLLYGTSLHVPDSVPESVTAHSGAGVHDNAGFTEAGFNDGGLNDAGFSDAGFSDNAGVSGNAAFTAASTQLRPESPPPAYGGAAPGDQLRRGEAPQPGHQPRGQWPASPPAGREPVAVSVAALRRAQSVREFEALLQNLESLARPQHRASLRAALDVDAMNAAARFVELSAREELLRRLLRVAYGPRFEDLEDDNVQKHFAKIVKECQSDQVAMMLVSEGAEASRRLKQKTREIAVQRWATGGSAVPAPTGRIAEAYRSARRNRYLPIITAGLAAAVLAVAFLFGGAVLGSSGGSGQSSSTSSDNTTTASPTNQPPPSSTASADSRFQPIRGKAKITPGPNHQVFGFLKIGEKYYPQSPCSVVSDGIWQCTSEDLLRGANLVAFAVPDEDANDLLNAPAGAPFPVPPSWGLPVPVS